MFGLIKKSEFPIGIDISDDGLRFAQLRDIKNGVMLLSADEQDNPVDIDFGSITWQQWAIESMHNMFTNGHFKGKDVAATIPATDVFIDVMKVPKSDESDQDKVILNKAKQKLPFDPNGAMIKYIITEEDNVLVMATEREKINRYLAVYEKLNLHIKSMCVWPVALTNCYCRFFGRRKVDLDSVVLLLDIGRKRTHLVVNRHKNVLYANSIHIGAKQLDEPETLNRMIMEIKAGIHKFSKIYKKAHIDRLVFMSGATVDRDICVKIAKQLEMAAHIGDCLSAVGTSNNGQLVIDRRNCEASWATAFGLSLS